MATKTKADPEANGKAEQKTPEPHVPDMERINGARSRLREAQSKHIAAASKAKQAKKEWEGAAENLLRVLDEEYDPQPTLFEATGAGPGDDDDGWREVPLAELDLAKNILEKLSDAGIETIGDLHDHGEPSQSGWVKRLNDVKGLGEKAVEKIEAALDDFWARRAKAKAAANGIGEDQVG